MKPTQAELYEYLHMFYCMGCADRGDDEEGCNDCPVGDIPLET